MKHWFKDQHFRSLLKNTSYLAISRVVAAMCSLVTLALVTHALVRLYGERSGVLLFGVLILITSYAKAASGIAKFQSWQLVVRYGGHGVANDNPDDFKTVTGFALALDVLSGIAGMLIAVAILPFVASWIGISAEYLWLAMLYCTLLPTMGAATPNGVLRVLDRFDLISWSGTVTPIARAMLAAAAFIMNAPFPVYVGIWYVTDLGGDLYTWYLGWREMRRHGLLRGVTPTLRPTSLPGAWKFAINVNLAASVQTVWGPVARLVVGGLLGPAGAALFRIASSLADSAQKPADLLGRAFYPEIVRMDLSSKQPWKLMIRGTALVGAVALVAILLLLLGGKPLIALLFGKAFTGAYTPLVILMVIPFVGILSFPLTPMLYALGKAGAPLRAKIYGSLAFFLTIAPLSWEYGIVGAAIALVLGNAVNVAVMLVQLRGEHRRVRAKA